MSVNNLSFEERSINAELSKLSKLGLPSVMSQTDIDKYRRLYKTVFWLTLTAAIMAVFAIWKSFFGNFSHQGEATLLFVLESLVIYGFHLSYSAYLFDPLNASECVRFAELLNKYSDDEKILGYKEKLFSQHREFVVFELNKLGKYVNQRKEIDANIACWKEQLAKKESLYKGQVDLSKTENR